MVIIISNLNTKISTTIANTTKFLKTVSHIFLCTSRCSYTTLRNVKTSEIVVRQQKKGTNFLVVLSLNQHTFTIQRKARF